MSAPGQNQRKDQDQHQGQRQGQVEVLELSAWGFDPNLFRVLPPRFVAPGHPARALPSAEAVLPMPERQAELFAGSPERFAAEFAGLAWSLSWVDLHALVAFQRRLVHDPLVVPQPAPHPDDLPGLFAFSFGPARTTEHSRPEPWVFRSANPDLQLRPVRGGGFALHGGSPFLEVACWQGRALLRDGYHRVVRLLRAGVRHAPAVLIQARHPGEAFPPGPPFFSREIVFGEAPPLVSDFLDPALTVSYHRPRLQKTLHVQVTESFAPEPETTPKPTAAPRPGMTPGPEPADPESSSPAEQEIL